MSISPPPPPPLPPGSPVAPVSGPTVPPPPRGPGVRVPFLAPPKDRNNTRIAVTIIVGVLALVLCGVGGVFGVGGLISWFESDMNDKAAASATAFLDDVTSGDLNGAYAQLCAAGRSELSFKEFDSEWQDIAPIGSTYGLSELVMDNDGNQYVPVTLTVSGKPGGSVGKTKREVDLYMHLEAAESENDQATMSVCGWEVRGY